MKRITYYILTFIVIISCDGLNTKKAKPKKKTYEQLIQEQLDINKKNDTTFLGFIFGNSKSKTRRHINKLIKQGKLKRYSKGEVMIDFDASMKIEGYPYEMQINKDENYKTLITPYYNKKGRLTDIGVTVLSSEHDKVEDFLVGVYGNYSYKKNVHDREKLFWLNGVRQATLIKGVSYSLIGFTDLREEIKRINLKRAKDSLQRDVSKLKKELTRKDFN